MSDEQQSIYGLISKIQVMKPNIIDEENAKQAVKLETLILSPDYAAETKIDGCHYLMGSHLFFSTNHIEKTHNFPHLRDFFKKLNMPNLILDGEINYPGRTSQYCTRVTGSDPYTAKIFQEQNGGIHYTIYDMLRTPKGTWMQKEPYFQRRRALEYFYNNFVKGTPFEEFIHITDMTIENKKQFIDDILNSGGEGAVIKQLNSPYLMGKRPMWTWMKIKQKDEADLIITGFEPPTVEYSGTDFDNWPYWKEINGVMQPVSKYYYNNWIGAIILSAYVDGELTRICTSSGIDENLRSDMSSFPENYLNRVAKIGYMERTEAGFPRHPKFISLHPDKTMDECTWEF